MQNSEQNTGRSLWEIEQEVLAEGQEWMRQRLQEKLQAEADQHGRVFPPQPTPRPSCPPTNHAPAHQRRSR